MNVDFSESYDHESDIYYVTFKTGEPSMVFETDDDLLLEVGLFTHTPTGFRILNFSKRQGESYSHTDYSDTESILRRQESLIVVF